MVEGLETYRLITGVVREMRHHVRKIFERHDLTGSQHGLLCRIPDGGIPITHLARESKRDPGNVTGIMDRLEKLGYAERRRSNDDRRVVMVFLTEKGQETLARVRPLYEEAVSNVMRGWPESDVAAVRDRMEMMRKHLESIAKEG